MASLTNIVVGGAVLFVAFSLAIAPHAKKCQTASAKYDLPPVGQWWDENGLMAPTVRATLTPLMVQLIEDNPGASGVTVASAVLSHISPKCVNTLLLRGDQKKSMEGLAVSLGATP